jgi:osmoprotectant transport system ATP-binding protein
MVTDKNKVFLGVATLKKLDEHYKNEELTLADIMDRDMKTLAKDATVTDVAEIFHETNVSAIPVLEGDKLIGVITRSSMMRGLAEWEYNKQ